jgi:hypothetical protein
MSDYFDLNTICYSRRNPRFILNHWDVTDDVCKYCGLRRPEIFDLDDTPTPVRRAPIPIREPAPSTSALPTRSATAPAITLPTLPTLRQGAGNTGRNASKIGRAQTVASPKKQSAFVPFHIKLSRFVYNDDGYPTGWFPSTGSWSKNQLNTTCTSEELLNELYQYLADSIRPSSEWSSWIHPTSSGEWLLSHITPKANDQPMIMEAWKQREYLAIRRRQISTSSTRSG